MTAALNENAETFVVYIAAFTTSTMQVYPSHQAQLELLLADKVFIEVLSEYLDYADIFSFDYVIDLPKITGINVYAIELVESKQPLYKLIYSLRP